MEVQQFIDLGKYGPIGVMLALIALCAAVMYWNFKMVTRHFENSNQIFLRVMDSLNKNTTAFDKNTGAFDRLTQRIEDLAR